MKFKIIPELRGYLRNQTTEENDKLRIQIVKHGCRAGAIVVANIDGSMILVDGHHSYALCLEHDKEIPEPVVINATTIEEAKDWMLENQLSRRNMTSEERLYAIGERYNRRKNPDEEQKRSPEGKFCPAADVAEEVAKESKVSKRTVKNAAKFADALNSMKLAEKQAVLNGESDHTKKEIIDGAAIIICIHCKALAKKNLPLIKGCKDCKLARELDRAKDRLCERCTQIGYQKGCTACQYLRENPRASQPPKEPDRLTDEAGVVVPQRLIKVFATVPLFRQAERELNALGKTFKQIESSPAKEAKPLDSKMHFEKFFGVFKNARWRVKNMRPCIICSQCEGDGCKWCEELGWLTSEAAKVKGMI